MLRDTKVSFLIYLWRCTRLVAHILFGVCCATFVLPFVNTATQHRLIIWWSKRLLTILSITVQSTGGLPNAQPDGQGRMLIANHISWVDIFAMMSVTSIRFIAKSEIRQWPVFGYLAYRANVLFINRAKRQEAKRMQGICIDCLKNGDQLGFFPEGTTTDGSHILPFKGSIMQAAIDAKAIIQPVAIYYPNPDQSPNLDLAFAGETTMVESLHRIMQRQSSVVTLHFFSPIDLKNQNAIERRSLTEQIHGVIKNHLYPNKQANS